MQWFYDLILFLTALPGLIWFRTKIIYEDKKKVRIKGGALVVSNHIGFVDPVYLMYGIWYRRHHFICMKELFEKPFTKWFFKMCMCIPIDRENLSMESFRRISDTMKEGKVVSMFPEGHVNVENSDTKQFKSGMVLMALKGNAPIVPVYIEQRKHFWNRLRVTVGQPIDIKAIYGDRPSLRQIDEIAELIFKKEKELKELAERTK